MEERNKRMSCIWKKVSCMPKPHSVEQLGYRTKCFSCFLTFGGSFQTTGELFSSFLSAPEVVLKGRLRGRMKSLFQFPRLITAWLECDVFISS